VDKQSLYVDKFNRLFYLLIQLVRLLLWSVVTSVIHMYFPIPLC